MLNFEKLEFHYEPYPIGRAHEVIAPDLYGELLKQFPPIELFNHYQKAKDNKYYLNEVKTRSQYLNWVKSHPVWREFNRWIKSDDFLICVFGALRNVNVDLDVPMQTPSYYAQARQAASDMLKYRRYPRFAKKPYTRFEFSILDDKGYIRPHTDAPDKIVTLSIYFAEHDWKREWGGGLDVNKAKDQRKSFNYANAPLQFGDVDVVRTFEFLPNQCVLFVKTYNSLHSVRPLNAPKALRRSININIEYE